MLQKSSKFFMRFQRFCNLTMRPTATSLAPQFDDLINVLQSATTFHSATADPVAALLRSNAHRHAQNRQFRSAQRGGARTFPLMRIDGILAARRNQQQQQQQAPSHHSDDEKKVESTDTVITETTSTNRYRTDLKGKETKITSMVLSECDKMGLTSARLYRAPPTYYQEKIEWRRDVLSAPDTKYLCKSLLMRNTRCIYKDCSDPTNSLYYLVIFVCRNITHFLSVYLSLSHLVTQQNCIFPLWTLKVAMMSAEYN